MQGRTKIANTNEGMYIQGTIIAVTMMDKNNYGIILLLIWFLKYEKVTTQAVLITFSKFT